MGNQMIAKADVRTELQNARALVQPKLNELHAQIEALNLPAGHPLHTAANETHQVLAEQFSAGLATVEEQGGAETFEDGNKPPPHP